MAKVQEIGPYSAYAIAKKYGYQGTEEEWIKEQEANRKASEAAAAAAAQSAKDAAASASGVAQSGQQAVQSIKDAQTAAEQAIDTAKQQAVQAAQAEAEKAATSAGQAASSATEAAQSATNAAAEVGKVQSAGTSAVQAVQAAQNTATEAVSAAQQTATQTVSEAQATAVSAVQEAGTTQTSAVASAASSALKGISDAKDAALSDVAEAGEAQVSSVDTAGTSAVQDVNDAKTAALEAIGAANAALPSPAQSDAGKVPTVKADGSTYELAGPYAPLSAAIRPTASGNPVSITDSVEWPLLGLKVYGKSTQDGTPSPESPAPITNAGASGSIDVRVAGKNLFDYSSLIENKAYAQSTGELIANTGYMSTPKISVIPGAPYRVNANNPNVKAAIWVQWDKEGNLLSREGSIISNYAKNLLPKTVYLAITFYNNVESQWLEKAIISYGLDEIVYEPYKGLQSLPLSTPSGLPGIPVDSGGNYTDTSGQQWVCDEVDFARGVYGEKVLQYTFDGSMDENWMEYNSNGTSDTLIGFEVPINHTVNYWITPSHMMCNLLAGNKRGDELVWTWSAGEGIAGYSSNILVAINRTTVNSVVAWKEFLQSHPMTVLLPLDEAIETSETSLSPEELAAYRALHTYDGTTVVSTTEPVAGIEARYVADGTKIIENLEKKISDAVTAAITLAGGNK